MRITIGTRGSDLALTQARHVASLLEERGAEVSLRVLETSGDKDLRNEFGAIGPMGVFVREVERALQAGEIDLAVHSHKDLPSETPPGLVVAAVPGREDPRDVLVVREESLDPRGGWLPLRAGARVGTASARRKAFLAHLRPDLGTELLRGNVQTRLRRTRERELDATLLAAAGLARLAREAEAGRVPPLELDGFVCVPLDPDLFVPAPAQGALALEVREQAREVRELVASLDDPAVRRALAAERGLLELLEGGCQLSLGAHARPRDDGTLELVAALEPPPQEDGLPAAGERWVRCRVAGSDPGELARRAHAILTGAAGDPGRPLEGRTVLLTRAADDNARWGARLEEAGARVRSLPCISVETLPDAAEPLAAALAEAGWLALTSRRGAEAVRALTGALPPLVRVAAVGPSTAEAARALFGRCDLVAPGGTGASLGSALAGEAAGERVLIAAAAGGRAEVEAALAAAGVNATRVEVYRTTPAPREGTPLDLEAAGIDAVVVASPSAVTGLSNRTRSPAASALVTIGPTTSEAARAAGLAVAAEAPSRDADGIVAALASALPGARR